MIFFKTGDQGRKLYEAINRYTVEQAALGNTKRIDPTGDVRIQENKFRISTAGSNQPMAVFTDELYIQFKRTSYYPENWDSEPLYVDVIGHKGVDIEEAFMIFVLRMLP